MRLPVVQAETASVAAPNAAVLRKPRRLIREDGAIVDMMAFEFPIPQKSTNAFAPAL